MKKDVRWIAPNLFVRRERSFVFRFTSPVTGNRREMGLGVYTGDENAVKEVAAKLRAEIRAGVDPLQRKADARETARVSNVIRLQGRELNILRLLRAFHESVIEAKHGTSKYARQWIRFMERTTPDWLKQRGPAEVDAQMVMAALRGLAGRSMKEQDWWRQRMAQAYAWLVHHGKVPANVADVLRNVRDLWARWFSVVPPENITHIRQPVPGKPHFRWRAAA